MENVVFVTHECGNYAGHGGVASYINLISKQIVENYPYDVYILTTDSFEGKDIFDEYKRIHVVRVRQGNLHEQGKEILNIIQRLEPIWVEGVDYLGLLAETLGHRSFNSGCKLSNTKFITVHHTASRECYEWNDKVPVKFAGQWIQECYCREKMQMHLSDLNIAPSKFMQMYVAKNYDLKEVVTINHPQISDSFDCVKNKDNTSANFDTDYYKDKFVISCISRVEGRKNQLLLVREFIYFIRRTNANAVLLIIGNESINSITGEYTKDEIFEIIPDALKNSVLFFEFMDEKAKNRIYSISQLSVLASTFECLSLSLSESVSKGVPAICSKYCGFSDYIENVESTMTFDPFIEHDLSRVIENFYFLDEANKARILEKQQQGLRENGSVEKTIANRMKLYFGLKKKYSANSNHFLIIDENNYLKVFGDDDVDKNYDGIVVPFYYNNKYIETIVDTFSRISDYFSNSDIIAFGCDTIQLHFINVLLNRRPFFIKGVRLDKSFVGIKYHEIISKYANSESEVYSLLNETHSIADAYQETPAEKQLKRRELFVKKMISGAFYSCYRIDQEECLK